MRSIFYLYFAWIVSITGTLGSLYYSYVLKLPPCDLCWYQRAMMYPLVLVLLVGIILVDKNVYKYAFPLALCGFLLALYHEALTLGLIPSGLVLKCFSGVSCSSFSYIFGFFSIPLQSLVGFFAILTSLYLYKRNN